MNSASNNYGWNKSNKESEEKTMNVKELAKKYYPTYWDINRMRNLVAAGKLSEADYQEITGSTYRATE